MIIRYANGKTMEGVALSRQENTLRVALRGHNDAIELFQVNGRWITEDWEPVWIQSGLDAHDPPSPSEADFVCSRELASRLIHLLGPETAVERPAGNWAAEKWSAAVSPCPM